MTFKGRYFKAKQKLLSDESICTENRNVFTEFFEYQERKLKRMNGLRELDEANGKTLYGYIIRFRNVNKWFGNKPWRDLTREDIRRVYDDLEDGKILTQMGRPVEDRQGYYDKIMKSKPFRIVQKSELAKEVIEFRTQQRKDVRFITEETFRTMVSVISKPTHLLLFWLAWDIGENINSLLMLRKRDFTRQTNPHTNEPEYLLNLRPDLLKRSRRSRSEPTLYPETVRFADMALANCALDDPVFTFGYRQALKVMHNIAKKTGVVATPVDVPVMWKDLRSGMACHLLKAGWSREEVDPRLGRTPNSSALNAYINFLALDHGQPKKKLHDTTIESLRFDLAAMRDERS